MCKVVTYNNAKEDIHYEEIDGELYFVAADIARCLGYAEKSLHYHLRREKTARYICNENNRSVYALNIELIKKIAKKSYREMKYHDFLEWLDQFCEEHRPAPIIKPEAVPALGGALGSANVGMMNVKEFCENAAQFFAACAKVLAYNSPS